MCVCGLVEQVHRWGISVVTGLRTAEQTTSNMLWGKQWHDGFLTFSSEAAGYIKFSSQR